jgi:chromosome segregation ATPase
MKLFFCLLSLLCVQIAHTQIRDVNKTSQVEQLQQIKQTVSRKIDTLHLQLNVQLAAIADIHKKLDQLKKENSSQDKPDMVSKDQKSRLQQELNNATGLANKLQKKYDQQVIALDKAVNLEKDLEEKIIALVREDNR